MIIISSSIISIISIITNTATIFNINVIIIVFTYVRSLMLCVYIYIYIYIYIQTYRCSHYVYHMAIISLLTMIPTGHEPGPALRRGHEAGLRLPAAQGLISLLVVLLILFLLVLLLLLLLLLLLVLIMITNVTSTGT